MLINSEILIKNLFVCKRGGAHNYYSLTLI